MRRCAPAFPPPTADSSLPPSSSRPLPSTPRPLRSLVLPQSPSRAPRSTISLHSSPVRSGPARSAFSKPTLPTLPLRSGVRTGRSGLDRSSERASKACERDRNTSEVPTCCSTASLLHNLLHLRLAADCRPLFLRICYAMRYDMIRYGMVESVC